MKIEKRPFGKVEGKNVVLFTLTNDQGMSMSVTNYGGIVTSFFAPDKTGAMADIVLGNNNVDSYVKNNPYFGAIIGRYGNRIGKAAFTLNGKKYALSMNDGENTLHGGAKGFDKVVWEAKEVKSKDAVGIEFKYLSKDGEQGFPGNLTATVIYWLTNKSEFTVEYSAITDKETVVNLTQHNYWNLSGEGSGDILNHELFINADNYTPVDAGLIPLGKLSSVKGTPMDFTEPIAVGMKIKDDFEQLKIGKGFDHNWVLNRESPDGMAKAAVLYDPKSGRLMEISTCEPAIQFYSGNFLDGKIIGKSGKPYAFRNALCLETQHFPDSPNKPDFPTTVLKPGHTFKSTTIHKFSVKK
jgi:aldose 1-epimerase